MSNKFNESKQYAEKNELHWGFVKDSREEQFINNTEYVDDMSDGVVATKWSGLCGKSYSDWKTIEEQCLFGLICNNYFKQ